MEFVVHFSIHPKCHHQITYAKFSLKIHYPSPLKRKIWHYDQVNVDHIRKAVNLFPWEKALRNVNINDMMFYLTKRLRILFLIIFLMKKLT